MSDVIIWIRVEAKLAQMFSLNRNRTRTLFKNTIQLQRDSSKVAVATDVLQVNLALSAFAIEIKLR